MWKQKTYNKTNIVSQLTTIHPFSLKNEVLCRHRTQKYHVPDQNLFVRPLPSLDILDSYKRKQNELENDKHFVTDNNMTCFQVVKNARFSTFFCKRNTNKSRNTIQYNKQSLLFRILLN